MGPIYDVLGTMIGQNEYVIIIVADQGQFFSIAVLIFLWRGRRSTGRLTKTLINLK